MNGITSISCRDSNQCQNTTITCESDEDCFISCSAPNACQSSTIKCANNQLCVVLCEDISSCKDLSINARFASQLDIVDCSHDESCIDMTIFCPKSVDGNPVCNIEGIFDIKYILYF